MKKLIILSIAACTFILTACNNQKLPTKAELKDEVDSINYAFGVVNGDSFKNMIRTEDATEENLKSMLVGFENGFKELSEEEAEKSTAITYGIQLSNSIQEGYLFGDSAITANKKLIFETIDKIFDGEETIDGFNKMNANQYFFKIYQLRRDTTLNFEITKEIIDSLNIAYAVIQGANFTGDINDKNKVEFIKNFKKGRNMNSKKEQFKYLGYSMANGGYKIFSEKGFMQEDSTIVVRRKVFLAGINAGTLNDTSLMDGMSASNFLKKISQEKIEKRNLEQYKDWKEENTDFLAKKKEEKNIKSTPSGLLYEVIKEGKGKKPQMTDLVEVHYKGTLIDGTEFDSSIKRGQTAKFGLNQVIKGWTEGLQLMPVGSKYRLYIPQELGYGNKQMGEDIKPFSTLIFEIELISIAEN